MIILFGSGRHFGLPDGSPFVTKAEMLLRLSGLAYAFREASFRKAPKGKIPYITDDGQAIGDSTLIRDHLERRHGIDFSGGYGPRELALGWTLERMLEEHLYFLAAHDRWMDDANFSKGPAQYFKAAPAPIRPLVAAMIRRQVRKTFRIQGLGRHSADERFDLGRRDLDAVAELLGANRYLLGDRVCGADATAFGFLIGLLCPLFESRLRRHAESLPGLVDYVGRMKREFFADLY